MKRTFLSDVIGRTIENMVEGADWVLLLLSGDGALYLRSGCYDEDDHYVEVYYPTGPDLVRQGVLTAGEALEYRLIDEADIALINLHAEAEAARKKQRDLDTYQLLKKLFGDSLPLSGTVDLPVRTEVPDGQSPE